MVPTDVTPGSYLKQCYRLGLLLLIDCLHRIMTTGIRIRGVPRNTRDRCPHPTPSSNPLSRVDMMVLKTIQRIMTNETIIGIDRTNRVDLRDPAVEITIGKSGRELTLKKELMMRSRSHARAFLMLDMIKPELRRIGTTLITLSHLVLLMMDTRDTLYNLNQDTRSLEVTLKKLHIDVLQQALGHTSNVLITNHIHMSREGIHMNAPRILRETTTLGMNSQDHSHLHTNLSIAILDTLMVFEATGIPTRIQYKHPTHCLERSNLPRRPCLQNQLPLVQP